MQKKIFGIRKKNSYHGRFFDCEKYIVRYNVKMGLNIGRQEK